MESKRYGIDLTQGRVNSVLLRFVWPFIAANLVTALHGVISMLVVGQFTDSVTLSGVANGTQIMFPPVAFIMGLGTGGTVLIGRSIGQKDKEAGTRAVGSFACVSITLVVFLTLFVLLIREPLLSVLKTPAEALASARRYVLLCTIGVPFNAAYGMICAVARGMGNSKAPSVAAGISCAVNIALSLLLVGVFELAEAGVAIATSAAQFVSFTYMALWIYNKKLPFPFSLKDVKADAKSVKFLLTVGFPLILQELLISISFMVNTNRVNSLGVEASASVGVVSRLFNLAVVVPNSFGASISAMTAQNNGAGKRERAVMALRWGVLFSLIINLIFFLLCQFVPESITSLFAKDPLIISGSANYLRSFSFEMLTIAASFCLNAYLSGCGKSSVSMWYVLASAFLVRVPLSIYITGIAGLDLHTRLFYLGFASPTASLLSMLCGLTFITWYNKKNVWGKPPTLTP